MEESSDIKKVLDSFSGSVSRGFMGARDFVNRQVKAPIVVDEQKKSEPQPNLPSFLKTGGRTMTNRYMILTYHGGEQSDEIHYADTLAEARTIASQAEHAEIIDQKTNESVFSKGGKTEEWIYWRVEKGDYTVYEKTNPASPNIPNAKRISKEEYEANVRRGEEYAKGGVTENLVKELHKLQRELNSSRLSTYKEGDNSPEEQARQRERASKLARFNEVLQLLRESDSKYAKGGMVDLFEDYENIPPKIQEILDRYSEDFEDGNYDGLAKALKEVEANGYTFEYYVDGSAYGLRPIDVPLSDLEGFEEEEFAKGGQISTGDWVTYKTDGKRYKVKRVLNNNMLEIASGSTVLMVSMDDVETTTKFYRAKFVKVPTNVQVSYKIGDRVKFATKKGEEKGVIKLYKYIPTTNKIMYVIKTDSGWNANVYQDNVALESSASTTTTPKASKKSTKTSSSGFAKGDKVVVKDASNLSGIVTEVISANEVAVDVKDSLGITMKIGVITNMTFSTSELEKA